MSYEIESNDSTFTATEMSSGQRFSGQLISSSDKDFYKVYSSGGQVSFNVELPGSTYSHDYFRIDLYDASGVLQKSYQGDDATSFSMAAPTAGYYYLSVSDDYSWGTASNGDYYVTATCD